MKRIVFSAIVFVGACGSSGGGGTPPADSGTTGGQADAAVVAPSIDAGTTAGAYSLSIGPIHVASGGENTQCVVKRLGNAGPIHVGQIHNTLGPASHHMIVYRTTDSVEQLTPFDCQPFVETLNPDVGNPLMITQKAEERLQLPQGIAYTLAANQMIRLELHYINTTDMDMDVTATSEFIPISDADYKDDASFLFIGNPDITLPAMQDSTLGPTYFPLPDNLAGSKFFAITGHTHRLGTDVTIETTTGKGVPGTSVYDVPDWIWSEPATVFHDPPFEVPAGGGFNFTCKWTNYLNQTIRFGESAENEMCFFWAYYYPSKGAYTCVHTDQVAGGYDMCCPGNPFCSQFF